MKNFFAIAMGIVALFFLINAHAVKVHLEGIQARTIYKSLTAVEEDGAAGHFYRRGKSILCRYTNADMDDSNGQAMAAHNPKRYTCVIQFDKSGLASPGTQI